MFGGVDDMNTVVESPNRRFRPVQTWSARAVRWSSCAILLRPGPAAGEAGRPPEPATTGSDEQMFGADEQVRTSKIRYGAYILQPQWGLWT
jgi:hypothetical protein